MSSHESPLFDVDEIAPAIPPAVRLAHSQNVERRAAVQNAHDEIHRAPPYLVNKLARIANEGVIVVEGVSIPLPEIYLQTDAET